MSNIKYDMYKKVTDEFHLLYNAFRESGFTKEEAFELVKCYCTSANLQGLFNQVDRACRLKETNKRLNEIRNANRKKKEDNDET